MRNHQKPKAGRDKWRSRHNTAYEEPLELGKSVGDLGIMVYRSIGKQSLDGVLECFSRLTSDIVALPRGLGEQRPPAVNLLQRVEVNHERERLGRIATSDALDSIYRLVPTLRRELIVKPKRVELFGHPRTTLRPVGISFDDESAQMLSDERGRIRATLEDLSEHDHEEFEWIENSQPHVSLGKIDTSQGFEVIRGLIDGIREVCPDSITLLRATLYNPDR